MQPMQEVHASYDEVAELWTPAPRFIQIMRGGNGFQHPQYFFSQTEKLISLLNRATIDTTVFGSCEEYAEAWEILTQLLNESQYFGGLTRSDLKALEPNVRSFIDKIQAVDGVVAEWDMRKRMTRMETNPTAKKRSRTEDWEENVFSAPKRTRDTCSGEAMDAPSGFKRTFAGVSLWVPDTSSQPVLWTEQFYQ